MGDYVRTPSGYRGTVTQVDRGEQIAIVQRPDIRLGVAYDFDELTVISYGEEA